LFDCANPIAILHEPPEGWLPVFDVIALPGEPILQRGRFDDELGRSFSKFGLVIRADQALTLIIAKVSRPNALMGWNDGLGSPVEAIEIAGCSGTCLTDYQPNCPLGESGNWVAYPGGVWTIDAACIEIEIETADQAATAELPIGVECT
jgi:hypothetical protein